MSEQAKRTEGGRFAPGVSGNPKGRPRAGTALAECLRVRLEPDKVVDLVLRFADDETVPLKDRLGVLLPWVHAGYNKPPTSSTVDIDATVRRGELDPRKVEKATTEQLEQLMASFRGLLVDEADSAEGEP